MRRRSAETCDASASASNAGVHPRHSAGSRRVVKLSDASAPEWCPAQTAPGWGRVFGDAALGVAAFVAVNFLGSSSLRDAVALMLRPSSNYAVFGCAVGLAVSIFAAASALPEVSHRKLVEAEAILLATVRGDVRHHWSRFATQRATWHVHSLQLRSAAPPQAGSMPPEQRPAVVLLHGHSAGAAHWEAVMDGIAQLADVHVLDMPGWGRSPAPVELASCTSPSAVTELTMEMLAGWMDCNRLRRVVLLGHSLGGFNAIHFAHRHPGRVVQLIVVAPAGLAPAIPEAGRVWGAYFKWAPPQLIARVFGRLGFVVFRALYLAFTKEDRRFPDYYYQLAAATAATGMADVTMGRFLRLAVPAPPASAPPASAPPLAQQRDAAAPAPSSPRPLSLLSRAAWYALAALRGELFGLYWGHPCLSLLMALDMPVSVIWGQCDEIVPPILSAVIHRIRPRTDTYLVRAALHNPAHNNMAAFTAAVADCILKYRGLGRCRAAGHGCGGCATAEEKAVVTAKGGCASHCSAGEAPAASAEPERAVPAAALRRCRTWEDGTADKLLLSATAADAVSALLERAHSPADAAASCSTSCTVEKPTAPAAAGSLAQHLASCGGVQLLACSSEGDRNPSPLPLSSPLSVSSACSTGGARAVFGDSSNSVTSGSSAGSAAYASSSSEDEQPDGPAVVVGRRKGRRGPHPWIDDWTTAAGAAAAGAGTPTAAGVRAGEEGDIRSGGRAPQQRRQGGGTGGRSSHAARHILRREQLAALGSTAAERDVTSQGHPSFDAPLSPAAAATHDGVVSAIGRGRGYCNACFHAVCLHKSYWRCACGAWSFNAAISTQRTRLHFAALLAFLDELYVTGTFSAPTSQTVIMPLAPRSSLPRPHPPALRATLESELAEAAASPQASQPPPPSAAVQTFLDVCAASAGASLDQPVPAFAPLAAPFDRGQAFLLE